MDDDLGSVASHGAGGGGGVVEVVVGAAPGQGSERARERGVLQRGDQGAAEATTGTGDGDAHQADSPGGVAAGGLVVGSAAFGATAGDEPAIRSPYWRA